MPNDITENDIYKAMGLEAPADTENAGEKAQEVTDPAVEDDVPDGSADAAEDNSGDGSEDGATADIAEPEQPETGDDQPMSAEERHANAARRRKAEQQKAIDEAVQRARAEEQQKYADYDRRVKNFFKTSGLKNSIDDTDITSLEDAERWKNDYDEAKIDSDLQNGRLTKEALNAAVAQTMNQMRDEERRIAEAKAAFQAQVDKEIAEINSIDPSIKSVEDLLSMPDAAKFREKIDHGYSFVGAFKEIRAKEIEARKFEEGKAAERANAASKNHLSAVGATRGAGNTYVPKEELELFRQLNPNASDAEISKYYEKYKNSK